MKQTFYALAAIALSLATGCGEPRKYDIEITFCDGRPPVRKTVYSRIIPCSHHIETYKQAVPIYRVPNMEYLKPNDTLLNVCDIQVLKEYAH